MAVDSRVLSPPRSAEADDIETIQVLVIFCGTGLLLSLFLAITGWI